MKSPSDQLAFAKALQARLEKGLPDHVKAGRMTNERAQSERDCMAAIVATLEQRKLLEEVSEEMKGRVAA